MFLRMGPKKQRREVPVASLVPNLLTTLALCAGLASIHLALMDREEKAMIAIGLSAVFDTLDGRAARMLKVSSKFGAVLDSLSDFVSFGVAPAIILHQWFLKLTMAALPAGSPMPRAPFSALELGAVMVFALCSALRLARFTAAAPAPKSPAMTNYFVGLPTPAAAGAVLIPAMIRVSDDTTWEPPQWVSVAMAIAIGLLMVSRVPTFAFKKLKVRRPLVAPLLILVGLAVVSLTTHFWLTLAGISALNLALIPMACYLRSKARASELMNETTMVMAALESDDGPAGSTEPAQ